MAEFEPRVAIIEGSEPTKKFVIVETWSRKENGGRNKLVGYRHEEQDFDDARTFFWSQVFNDSKSLFRMIDYAKDTNR